MSKRIQAKTYGGPEVLELVDVEVPAPGPGQVVIDVHAAGMNPSDFKTFGGMFGRNESRLPLGVGNEVAGVVVAVGEGADGPLGPISVGQSVVASPVSGGWAERVTAKAANVYPKPVRLDDAQAANLLLVGATAMHMLDAAVVGTHSIVLIHGGSGAVGLIAVQLAKLRGARVIATASPANFATLERFGAEPVAYGDGLTERVLALAPGGVTASLDTIGNDEALATSLAVTDAPHHIATIANFSTAGAAGAKVLGAGPGADPGTALRNAARAELIGLADEGELTVVVARTYPLADAREAVALLQSGHPGGKIALIP